MSVILQLSDALLIGCDEGGSHCFCIGVCLYCMERASSVCSEYWVGEGLDVFFDMRDAPAHVCKNFVLPSPNGSYYSQRKPQRSKYRLGSVLDQALLMHCDIYVDIYV